MKTNFKRIKRNWMLSSSLIVIGTIVWIVETIYFLIAYGWHLKAISETEKLWDDIVVTVIKVGFLFGIIVVFEVVDYLLSTKDDE